MSNDRDVLWADLVQFDTTLADRVWDGDVSDPDAPAWYRHLGYLIVRARGPADPDELADEPVVVPTMARVGTGRSTRLDAGARHRRPRVRTVGRIAAMKASAAATTVGMVGVAAATTGIVATVAATVVVPAISADRDVGISEDVTTSEEVSDPADGTDPRSGDAVDGAACAPGDDPCASAGGPVVVDLPSQLADSQAPADGATPETEAVEPGAEPTATGPAPADAATSDAATSDPATTTGPASSDPAPAAEPVHGDPSPPGLPAPLVAEDPLIDDAPGASEAAPGGGPPIERASPRRWAGSLRG